MAKKEIKCIFLVASVAVSIAMTAGKLFFQNSIFFRDDFTVLISCIST